MCTSIWSPTASTMAGSALDAALGAVELAAAVVAHDQRVGAGLDRQAGVLTS
jgi:hypothetical protein